METIKEFIKEHKDKIILIIIAILIAGASFAAGFIYPSNSKKCEPIIINNQNQESQTQPKNQIKPLKDENKQETVKPEKTEKTSEKTKAKAATEKTQHKKEPKDQKSNCQFVASNRGHKYYNADSSSAKSLKEENKICFPSEKEAKTAGYEPSASLSK